MYYSFVMLKPDALKRSLAGEVMRRLRENGFSIEHFGYVKVTAELLDTHYEEAIARLGESFKERANKSYEGTHMIPVILGSEESGIISRVRAVVGATDPSKAQKGTIRGDLGADSIAKAEAEGRICENLIHACDSYAAFARETALWLGAETAQMYAYDEDKAV